MQGDKRIDKLMLPVLNAINRHVKDRDAKTDIYNRAYEAVMISMVVKNEQRHIEFCPNCEADVPCTHEAELFVCDICGEDFAKYIVSRNCNVSDVSMTRDVTTPEPPEDALNARIAELKGVIEILEDQQREVKNHLIDKNLHIDSLYEEGYKLQQRIAELEAENAGLKERVAMLDVTAVFKSLGEMGYIEQTNRLHARIAELEAEVEALKAECRWTPVSERLPELGAPILFYDSILERINKGTCTAMNSDNTNLHWFTDDDLFYFGDRSEYVTHWMPLPKLPEVQE